MIWDGQCRLKIPSRDVADKQAPQRYTKMEANSPLNSSDCAMSRGRLICLLSREKILLQGCLRRFSKRFVSIVFRFVEEQEIWKAWKRPLLSRISKLPSFHKRFIERSRETVSASINSCILQPLPICTLREERSANEVAHILPILFLLHALLLPIYRPASFFVASALLPLFPSPSAFFKKSLESCQTCLYPLNISIIALSGCRSGKHT